MKQHQKIDDVKRHEQPLLHAYKPLLSKAGFIETVSSSPSDCPSAAD